MDARRALTAIAAVAILAFASMAVAQPVPGNLILQVPDWNQPAAYPAPPPAAGYPMWCSPTAAANLMGYWEDVKGCAGLTDAMAFPNSPAYPNTAGTWQQGLWHDGNVELGWFMGTDGWVNPNTQFPPGAAGTALVAIGPGMLSYATGAWVDVPGGITKVAYPNTTIAIDTKPPTAVMWQNYTAEIDASRPVVCSFDKWVDATKPGAAMTIAGFPAQSIVPYLTWDLNTDPHSVTGVGYIDLNPAFLNNGQDEWFVVQDNWGTTVQYVAVPLDTMWQQNDYVTDVPEPATLALLSLGIAALIRRRRS